MARATSGLGQFRGKVGSVVFRVNQGQQIASAYQPAVRNPKSNLQTAQRNKMYLASQLSKAVPREDIIGLLPNGSARDRRATFLRNIIDNTTTELNGETFTSRVHYENVIFSNGRNIIGAVNGQTEGTLDIFVEQLTEEMYNRLAIKAITFYSTAQFGVEAYKSEWLDLPEYSSVSNGKITITGIDAGQYLTYLVPVLLKDNVRYSKEKKTLLQIAEEGYLTIVGEYALSNAILEWGRSVALTTGDFGEITPPSADGDHIVNPDGPSFPNLG